MQTLAPGGGEGKAASWSSPPPRSGPRGEASWSRFAVLPTVTRSSRQSSPPIEVPMAAPMAALFFSGFGGGGYNLRGPTSRVVPGPEGAALCSPTHVALPGKRGASGNGGSPCTQRGARWLRGCRSIPIHTYPGGTLGVTVGRPGQVRAEMLWLPVPKAGLGMVWHPHHLPLPPVIGERTNPIAGAPRAQRWGPRINVGCHRNRWLDREVPGPRGFGGGGTRGIHGLSYGETLTARIARVRSWRWDTSYGEQRVSSRVVPATLWPP
jgi:hypothetical protein